MSGKCRLTVVERINYLLDLEAVLSEKLKGLEESKKNKTAPVA
eukprot:CAMPEP_0116879182 /NCGR_PEP_ID=MMETSP0463-20121206/10966_1 /TAXON_ID=181622 /ORGANISM="Strombidinopsis sp, Strain SopsisLIS2011" /LENGTH=42 /DNA_ID= /DNA_START= /DNA_END= /DNA_ORIENTATION=